MISVSPSDLRAVGYENGVLQIAFHSGGVYHYFGVPKSVYTCLLNAPSKGKYFAAHIKHNYPYQRVA